MHPYKERIINQTRMAVLERIAVIIVEHDVTQDELASYLQNRVSPAERLQATRRKVDLSHLRRAAGKKSAEVREQRRKEGYRNWRTEQQKKKQLATENPVELDIPEETSAPSQSSNEFDFFLGS